MKLALPEHVENKRHGDSQWKGGGEKQMSIQALVRGEEQ